MRAAWTASLLDRLGCPAERENHIRLAELLPLFASAHYRSRLEELVLDRRRDAWLRTYVLRALAERPKPLSRETLRSLVNEFRSALELPGDPAERPPVHRLANLDAVITLSRAAPGPEGDAALADLVRSLDPNHARSLLLRDAHENHLTPPRRQLALERCLAADLLDTPRAWATFCAPQSREFLLAAGRLDATELLRATQDLTPDQVTDIFSGRPKHLADAVERLALPASTLLRHHTGLHLSARAVGLLRAASPRLRAGERGVDCWRPIGLLTDLEDPGGHLPRVLADLRFAEPIRAAATVACVRRMPEHLDYERLAPEHLVAALRLLRVEPKHRPLLERAALSPHLAVKHASLRHLPHLADLSAPFDDPLLELLGLGAAAAQGDREATESLARSVSGAAHVVLRAQALRSLSQASRRPDDYFALCSRALRDDRESFEMFYAPVTSEAALALRQDDGLSAQRCLEALVAAALALTSDDAWWALRASIGSWLGDDDAHIHPVWNWKYIDGRQRSAAP